jgi:hypothetical protein
MTCEYTHMLEQVWTVSKKLRVTMTALEVLWFWICVMSVLVPVGLIEFRCVSRTNSKLHRIPVSWPHDTWLTSAHACRYFVIPSLIVLLHVPFPCSSSIAEHTEERPTAKPSKDSKSREESPTIASYLREYLLLSGYVFVNAATIYMYLNRTFTWPDGSTARFMWWRHTSALIYFWPQVGD